MPVNIPRQAYELWLDEEVQDLARLEKLFAPISGGLMEAYPVSRRVNSPRNDDAACLEAAEEAEDDGADDPDSTSLFS